MLMVSNLEPGMVPLVELEPAPAVEAIIELRYFVLFTDPSSEWKARDGLRRMMGVDAWVPSETRCHTRHRPGPGGRAFRQSKPICLPIFRGYIFVPLNLAWSWGPLHSVPGIRHGGPFLMMSGHPAWLSEQDVAMIQEIELYANSPEIPAALKLGFKLGQRVNVVDGPFADRAAQISRLDSAERIELLMDILGRKTRIQATAAQIAKLS